MDKPLTGEIQQTRHKFASNGLGVNLMFKLLHIGPIGCFLYLSVSLRYGGSIISLAYGQYCAKSWPSCALSRE